MTAIQSARALTASTGIGEIIASGEAIFPRVSAQGSCTLSAGVANFTYWTAASSGSATTVITYTAGTAVNLPTYCAVGVYSVDASGNLTLLAATADLHTTLWANTFTRYASALTSTFARVAGQRYAMGALAAATGAPVLGGLSGTGAYLNEPPTLASTFGSGLSTLPASVAVGSLAGTFAMFAGVVQP